jgi:hypothetical protein
MIGRSSRTSAVALARPGRTVQGERNLIPKYPKFRLSDLPSESLLLKLTIHLKAAIITPDVWAERVVLSIYMAVG